MRRHLSKSRYLSGLQCKKRLWLEVNEPAKASTISTTQQKILDQGTEVGIRARLYFPGGLLIEIDHSMLEQNILETQQALTRNCPTIFEAAFSHDCVYVIADIITRNSDASWDLIEVKSSTTVHDEHIHDLALQKYVLEQSGLAVKRVRVMHINNQCVAPDLSHLFTSEDVTRQVERVIPDVPGHLAAFKLLLQRDTAPDVSIGRQCKQPHPCPYLEYCRQHVKKETVFDIPRLSNTKKDNLRKRGIIALDQLPPDYPLLESQRAYVERILKKQVWIDHEAIKAKLAKLRYPLYFLDFETEASAIPRFNGTRPYQQIPFQYSCHILLPDGRLEHRDYLHPDRTDPRPALIEALLGCIGNEGSVIAYNAGFEKTVLIELADSFPAYATRLKSITGRLWDQLDIFKAHYKHYDFGSSTSIKRVLPVLVPELSYSELNVNKGDQAQSVWNRMITTEAPAAKAKMAEDLKEYCQLDTLAMVKIHQVLTAQVNEAKKQTIPDTLLVNK